MPPASPDQPQPAPATTSPNTVEMTGPTAPTEVAPPLRGRLPVVVYVLAIGTFLMLTTEFVVAGILPEVATDLAVSLPQAAQLITVFAVGMIVGAPAMTLATMRLSKRVTLVSALVVFIGGHVVVALSPDFGVLLAARFVTAVATGAFWAVAAVVAADAAGPAAGARAIGIVGAGGSLATVLGVPAGAFLAQFSGWRGTFWALAIAAVVVAVVVARLVPAGTGVEGDSGVRSAKPSELVAGLRSGRLWLALLACMTTSGGVVAAYSFISPTLTDRAGVPAQLVPLVLTAFGIGNFVGTLLASRIGDARPGLVTILTPAATVLLLVAIAGLTGRPVATTALVVLLGFFGLSANGVLIHFAVRFAGRAGGLGSALAVSAFNLGTAIGTPLAGLALSSRLGLAGPASLGALIVALTLIPVTVLALLRRRDASPSPSSSS